ncbi:hypothetical protein N784_16485 [Pontibacillus litoralis JSM 072002]|uniref:Metal-dependent hydrolase n=1 Tax=Pontibacillus litoralis JSM 072002 TaxID=1385512 RepID=A0A0A5G5A1_9BACI|nr:hypothetical protein N784_16485 [Pontibacillus litoralis JSM 072002]
MLATSHQVMGFTWGMGTIALYNHYASVPEDFFAPVLFFGAVLFGALIPDIDTPKSKLGGPFAKWGFTLVLVLLGMELVTPGISQSIQFLLLILSPLLFVYTGHRKFTHSISFLALMGAYSVLIHTYFSIPSFYLIGFMVGVVSHLFGDFLTKRGIPIFYPFHRRYVKFLFTFRTGSAIETGITVGLILFNVILITTTVMG